MTGARCVLMIGVAGLLPLAGTASGQQAAADLDALTVQMTEQVKRLTADEAEYLAGAPQAPDLIQDTRELAEALEEFRAGLRQNPPPFRLRRDYSDLARSWQHLRARLLQPDVSRPALMKAVQLADSIDADLHRALGLKPLAPEYYTAARAPSGIAETRRLAAALDARAQYLASVAEADLPGSPLTARAVELAVETNNYHNALAGIDRPDLAQTTFGPLAAIADRLEPLAAVPDLPPRVRAGWTSFAAAYALAREHLGLPVPPPRGVTSPVAAGGQPSPVLALTDTLLGQVDAFLAAFAPAAGSVPQGAVILADARRLREDVAGFRADAARGVGPGALAFAFRGVDAAWLRLARRINRVARGRSGPNIRTAMAIGETVEQIHRALGMPGYAPALVVPATGPG